MTRLQISVLTMIAACCLAGCGPTVTVQNDTKFPVRVMVVAGDGSESLSPSPGESSSAEVGEGRYGVTVIRDEDWINYAKATRQFLNDQVANPNLTGPQLLVVYQRLKDIAKRMQDYQDAGNGESSCTGTVSQDSDGLATISTGTNGKLTVVCK